MRIGKPLGWTRRNQGQALIPKDAGDLMTVLRNQTCSWRKGFGLALGLALILVLVSCGSDPGPTPVSVQLDAPTRTPEPIPTVAVSLKQEEIPLILLSPADGAEVGSEAVRVVGQTRLDTAVAVNGIPVEVESDGTFQLDILLEEGANLVEVVSTDLHGQLSSQSVAVFYNALEVGLPLSLSYPPDGLEVSKNTVTVTGGTKPDAVVAINGNPVEVNAMGIFSNAVSLAEGINLIEVVATDLEAHNQSQSIVVFYVR